MNYDDIQASARLIRDDLRTWKLLLEDGESGAKITWEEMAEGRDYRTVAGANLTFDAWAKIPKVRREIWRNRLSIDELLAVIEEARVVLAGLER